MRTRRYPAGGAHERKFAVRAGPVPPFARCLAYLPGGGGLAVEVLPSACMAVGSIVSSGT